MATGQLTPDILSEHREWSEAPGREGLSPRRRNARPSPVGAPLCAFTFAHANALAPLGFFALSRTWRSLSAQTTSTQ